MHEVKILFVCSGNKKQGISPIVSNQGEAIQKLGVIIDYFPVIGKGFWGYFKHYFKLRRKIKNGKYTAVHAHYSVCGMLVSLSTPFHENIIVSLMGSFYKGTVKYYLIHFFARFSWKSVIVKSERMMNQINLKKAVLIPNGVSVDKYAKISEREPYRRELGFSSEKKYVIFVSDPSRVVRSTRPSKLI